VKRSTKWILAAAGGGVLVVFASMAGMIYLVVSRTSTGASLEAEKRLVLTTETLAAHGFKDLDPGREKCTTLRQFDGSRDITCTYHDSALYMVSAVQISRNSLDSRQSFLIWVNGMKAKVAMAGKDLTLENAPSLLTAGDQNYSAFLISNNERVGNVFVARKGRAVHRLWIRGAVFEDPARVRALFEPLLQESEREFGSR
jgi:hypothetical protein